MAPTNQKNKSHKTRFASKGQRHKHKIAKETVTTGASAAHRSGKASNVNRAQRLQQAKTLRDHRRADALSEKRTGGASGGAPKLIALVSLSGSVNINVVKKSLIEAAADRASAKAPLEHDDALMEGVESEGGGFAGGAVKGLFGQVTFPLQRHKVRISLVEAPLDLLGCLDVAKIADIVAFVAPAEGAHIDEQGRELLTVLRALGLPATTAFIQGLVDVPLKRRGEAKKATVATLQGQLGEDLKVHAADTPEDFKQLLRHISELRLSPPVWRNHRPYVIAEKLAFQPSNLPSDAPQSSGGTLLVSGYLRARALRAGQLVHVAGLGDCQLAQIDGPEDPCPIGHHRNRTEGAMEVETEGARVLAVAGPNDSEPLIRENEPDPTAGEQTWPTEEELASAEEERRLRLAAKKHKKKVVKGTSEYQAAWIVDESEGEEEDDDVAADGEDQAMGEAAGTADASDDEDDVSDDEAEKGTTSGRTSEVWPGEEGDAMDEDENMSIRQREEERRRLKELARGDEEFPDEVDTPMDVPARQRFAKYRGLKSFRTSPWDPKESLPREYAQIFAFDNFRRTQKAVLKKQEQADRESLVVPGMYVRLHLLITPAQRAQAEQLVSRAENGTSGLVTVMGLLQHETKMSVVHYSLKKSDSYTEPVKSKSELLFYTGLRTFTTRPIFSSDDMHMDKHKFERFLHPGRFSVATVFAPISFPPLPLLVFKEGVNGSELVATGAQREVDPDRVILKKIVLSGYPYRVHKRKAVVRFMFFNPEDVRWFKPLELWTKYGRRGRIKEPVGTHGSMKCVFEGVVQQRDAVCATLYKRVYPRWPEGGTI